MKTNKEKSKAFGSGATEQVPTWGARLLRKPSTQREGGWEKWAGMAGPGRLAGLGAGSRGESLAPCLGVGGVSAEVR